MNERRPLALSGTDLALEDLRPIAEGGVSLRLSDPSRKAVQTARDEVERLLAGDEVAYGINTGFGRFCRVRISAQQVRDLQVNLIRSHGTGVGEPLPAAVARLALAFRANALAQGHSGIRPETLDLLLELYNRNVVPWIPAQGSVGASGDLAPLAHLAQVLIGEGRARIDGDADWSPGSDVLARCGLEAVTLEAKEGLSLINGVQVSSALLADAVLAARRLVDTADVAGALTLEGLLGSAAAFDPRIHQVRPHPGQAIVSQRLRDLLDGSEILESHADCDRVQDAYSLRCMPQVHGAVRDALAFIEETLIREVNSATDNPLVFPAPDGGDILSGGNFHGAPIGYAADLLAIVVADLGGIAERRVERLVNPDLSGLPAFLSPDEGVQSGFMMAQVTAAALASENKILAHPASVDTIPTSAGTEDHVSMATHAATKVRRIVEHTETILAIELMIGLEALEKRRPLRSGAALETAIASLRDVFPPLDRDRDLSGDIARMTGRVREGFA